MWGNGRFKKFTCEKTWSSTPSARQTWLWWQPNIYPNNEVLLLWKYYMMSQHLWNRPFLTSLQPLLQGESTCKVFVRITLKLALITKTTNSPLALLSVWKTQGNVVLGNGLLRWCKSTWLAPIFSFPFAFPLVEETLVFLVGAVLEPLDPFLDTAVATTFFTGGFEGLGALLLAGFCVKFFVPVLAVRDAFFGAISIQSISIVNVKINKRKICSYLSTLLFSNNWRSSWPPYWIYSCFSLQYFPATPRKCPRKMAVEDTVIVNPMSIARAKNTNESPNTTNGNVYTDETDLAASRRPPRRYHQVKARRVHIIWDIFAVISVLTFVADIASDVVVCVRYSLDGSYLWSILTVAFVILSSIVTQIFSAYWFYEDSEGQTWRTYLLHLCQLGPIVRWD